MSKISLTYKGKEYNLEYSRQSVKTMEQQGFVLDELSSKPMTMIPMLFSGAFIRNHKGMKRSLIDEIYEEINDKSGFMEALMEMYAETLSTLMDDKEDTGNVSWSLVK
jgi:hypothetical protein